MPWKVKFTIVPRRPASSTRAISCAPVAPTGASTVTACGSSCAMSGTTAPEPSLIAFWRPKLPIAAGREHRWRYRLHWCRDHAWKPELATVAATRIGASNDGARLVVVDFAGGRLSKLADDAKPQVDAA